MKTIVHITADYPDAIDGTKTKAVMRLLDGNKTFNHIVYSLNRVNGFGGIDLAGEQGNIISLSYRAPPYGLGLKTYLNALAQWIIEDLSRRNIRADAFHAHKLTIEGYIGVRLSRHFGWPLMCSAWGNTDQKIIRFRPDLRRDFRAIAQHSSYILAATPWIASYLQDALGVERGKMHSLPIVSDLDSPIDSSPSNRGLVTVFNLNEYRNKNIKRVLKALKQLRKNGTLVALDIFGGGRGTVMSKLQGTVANLGLSDQITFRGPIPHASVVPTINQYQGFVLPSLRETYGMVFVEALYAGVPIVYPRGRAIDGFFDPQTTGYACEPRSVKDIGAAISHILTHEADLKNSIRSMQEAGELDFLGKRAVIGRYAEFCAAVTSDQHRHNHFDGVPLAQGAYE